MSHAKNKLDWCIKKARKELQDGKKHRGLVEITPNIQIAFNHLTKAEHNLKVTLYLQKGGFTDWCSSALFYTIYHCFLAIISKYGYESRNQECTFAVIASLIDDRKIKLDYRCLEKVSSLGDSGQTEDSVINIREKCQYSTTTFLEDEEYQGLLHLAMNILDHTKDILSA
jgi:uncharacterized protein (UPF0332 family)